MLFVSHTAEARSNIIDLEDVGQMWIQLDIFQIIVHTCVLGVCGGVVLKRRKREEDYMSE